MIICSMKPGHDGGVAIVDAESQELLLSYEGEKDSFPRYEGFHPVNLLEAAGKLDRIPEVFAVSGWCKGGLVGNNFIGAGYYGVSKEDYHIQQDYVFGKDVTLFSSSHALSHIWVAYGMSPYKG